MDNLEPDQRKKNMQAVGQIHTKPEIRVRKLLHRLGFRFRLHCKELPGTPDIVLPKYHACILVHGCFWHHHEDCKKSSMPKTNIEFWSKKILGNMKRDVENKRALKKSGWRVLVVWECETRDSELLEKQLCDFLRN